MTSAAPKSFACLFVLVLVFISTRAVSDDAQSIMREAQKQIEQRRAELNPVRIEYQIRSRYRPRLDVPAGDVEKITEVDWGAKGSLRRSSEHTVTSKDAAGTEHVPQGGPTLVVFDGKRTVRSGNMTIINGLPSYSIAASPEKAEYGLTPWYLVGEDFALRFLKQWLSPEFKEPIRVAQATEGNHRVTTLSAGGDGAQLIQLSLLPDQRYCVLRAHETHQNGVVFAEFTDVVYLEHQGHWIPSKSQYRVLASDGEPLSRSEYSLQTVTTDPAEISDDLFRIIIPAKAYIIDEDTGKLEPDPLALPRIQDIVAKERRFTGTGIAAWGTVVAIGLLVVLLVRRRLK